MLFRLSEIVACTAAAVAGGLLYGRFFASTEFLSPVCAAALLGAVAAGLTRSLRWGPLRTTLMAVVGFALLAIYGVLHDTLRQGVPSRQTAVVLAGGVVDGWARMLAVAPPADLRPDLLITPVLLTWTAAFTATVLAHRPRRVIAPVVPPLVAFVAALLFVGRQPGIQATAAAVFLVAALSLLLLRVDTDGRSGRRSGGRLAFGVPVVVVVASLGVLGGLVFPLAADDQRFDPRAVVSPPVRVVDALSPLAELKGQLREDPPRRLFTVRLSGDVQVDRVRVAALDQFDGVSWTSADRLLVAGHQLPVDPAMTRSRTVSARFTVEDFAGPFLPAVGWPAQLDITGDVGFGPISGVLVSTRSVARGTIYTVVGRVAGRDDGLARAAPSTTGEYRELPGLPSALRAVARELTAAERTPYAKLKAIEKHLSGLPYGLNAPPGHSYAALVSLLTGSGEGYAEQFASAFAVLARAVGFPARVVVGYRLGDSPTGTHVVTTREAHAWAEVRFEGYGWVVFEPSGTTPGAPSAATDEVGTSPADSPAAQSPPLVSRPNPSARRPDESAGMPGLPVVLAAVVAVVALSILSAKTVRRRRRRRVPGAAARVMGAWSEATDRLVERGVAVPASLTPREVAERATGELGAAADPVRLLAPLATAAVYAPDEPDEDTVDQAWSLELRLRRQLYPRRRLPRRLAAALDPRPLAIGLRARGKVR